MSSTLAIRGSRSVRALSFFGRQTSPKYTYFYYFARFQSTSSSLELISERDVSSTQFKESHQGEGLASEKIFLIQEQEMDSEDDSDFDDEDGLEEEEEEDGQSLFRLPKLISETGYCSRRIAEKFIRERRVTLKGKVVRDPAYLMEAEDLKYVEIDGLPLKRRYKPLSKSSKVAASTPSRADAPLESSYVYPRVWAAVKYRFEGMNSREAIGKKRTILMDRLQIMLPKVFNPKNESIRPVYRLSYKSEGLALYTDNGELAKLFHSPQLNFPMTFRLRVHGKLKPEKIDAIQHGKIHGKDGKKIANFEEFRVDAKGASNSWITVKTYEKDPKKIEQAFELLYLQCTRLICVGIGPYTLPSIFPGLYNYANDKKQGASKDKTDKERSQQNQVKEIPIVPDLHKLFLQLQNNRMTRKQTKVKSQQSTKK